MRPKRGLLFAFMAYYWPNWGHCHSGSFADLAAFRMSLVTQVLGSGSLAHLIDMFCVLCSVFSEL